MVWALMEKQGGGADHLLLALRVSRLEQIRIRNQHEPRRLGASQHHAGAPQDVRFEHIPISATYKCLYILNLT